MPSPVKSSTERLEVSSAPGYEDVLSPQALGFVGGLARIFGPEVESAMRRRADRRARWAEGRALDFLPETAALRASDWRVAPIPKDLEKRVVEITGPVDRKMIINALNSGADVFMADFEDSNAPTWENLLAGQRGLMEAVRRTLTH